MIRPTRAVEAIPATTPFIGPEQLMRETGRRELVRLGANESAFGPSPSAVEAMTGELPRLSWYGDPESLDLRDALAAKHRCRPEEIVVGSGIDDLMGLAVRAFVAPGEAALSTRGTYPTFNYHVVGYGGRRLLRPRTSTTARPIRRSRVGRATRGAADRLPRQSRQSERAIHLARRSGALLPWASARYALAARRGVRRFRRRGRAPAARLRGSSDPPAHLLEGVSAWPARASATRSPPRAASRRFRRSASTTESTGTPRSAHCASLEDEDFRTYVVTETARAREDYYRIARSLGRRSIESAHELRLHRFRRRRARDASHERAAGARRLDS